ncbi:hypothetical protein PENTCL1PPCAC_27028 [Pristionchus entomophagus]|uniref:Uncharacterized protein n=1 Tax=Pristionchus entomophagus TaxID=358040 RepID=A0AAV5UG00_9BILA|nr:hypothetical protein PENTCL1PPCAC_27028 [Pristionchus entomophagus]
MRVTCAVRAIVRSHEDAIEDVKNVFGIMKRYGRAVPDRQPADAQPFSVSSTQGHIYLHQLSKELTIDRRYPRPMINRHKNIFQKILTGIVDPKWVIHRSTYIGAQKALANREMIVHGSRDALKTILDAIRKKDLSSLSPLLLDDRILSEIATNSKLSSLTDRQLRCLEVSEDDYIGIDGIVDGWKRIDLPEDDPCGLLSSLRIGMSDKHDNPILSYSVDMMAILRKNILVSKMGSLPPPKDRRFMPAPSIYRLPYMRILYATVEFAHLGTDKIGEFSKEPFLLDFHVHSF